MIKNIVTGTSEGEPQIKRQKSRSSRSNPLFLLRENALNNEELSIMVEQAKNNAIPKNAGHGMAESKCFCLNAIVKWGRNLQPEIDSNVKIQDLLPRSKANPWESLSESVQRTVLKMLGILGQQSQKMGANLIDKTSWVVFELIRVPLHKGVKVPELEWHRDGGYINNFDNPCSCYADYSTIFMLSEGNEGWKGGDLVLQRNGIERKDQPPTHGDQSTLIQYHHNEAVTFYNKDSRHCVTQIDPKTDMNRIIFACCIYGQKETKDYRSSQVNKIL